MAISPVRVVQFLYGTETGTAKDVAERLAIRFTARGSRCAVNAVDDVPVASWCAPQQQVEVGGAASSTVLHIFIIATTGQGDTPSSMRATWDLLLDAENAPSLEGLTFAVFGLGDSTYEHYNFAAKKLHNRLLQLGATAVVNRGLGDEQDTKGFDEELEPWLQDLFAKVGLDVPEQFSFQPKYRVVTMASTGGDGASSSGPSSASKPSLSTGRFPLKVLSRDRLTAESHGQNVTRVTFERPASLTFEPGDALGVVPTNLKSDLAAVAKLFGNPVICVEPNDAALFRQTYETFFGVDAPLLDLIDAHFDLAATARRSLFEAMRQIATDAEDIERLTELARVVPEYDAYCWREKRTVLEVLLDFLPRIQLPLDFFLSVLPPLQPRWYSVSSPPQQTESLEVTVGLLEFKTPMGRHRQGICSAQLVKTEPGAVFQCALRRCGTMQGFEGAHVIAIGPGTGIAPCRSIALAQPQRCTVFTGNRIRAQDYLYGADFAERGVETFSAFSREVPPYKWRYVQHALVGEATRVAELLAAGACIFVSGNAKRMPQDVEEAVRSIVLNRLCGGDAAAAQRYMKTLKMEGRYINDTWS